MEEKLICSDFGFIVKSFKFNE